MNRRRMNVCACVLILADGLFCEYDHKTNVEINLPDSHLIIELLFQNIEKKIIVQYTSIIQNDSTIACLYFIA
jgi:hypothetical protein